MTIFQIAAILLTLTALFNYLNYRYIRLPTTIGVMLIALLFSLALIGLNEVGIDFKSQAARLLTAIDFDQTLMKGMLSFLLFAGALQINLNDLAEQKLAIFVLATGGVILSTFIFGTLLYFILQALGLALNWS
jgi:CPA1 family monovalent cation:H+ antiporter